MTERYVDGTNGNNSWDGLSPTFVNGTNGPKATLNGAEDTPVVAGDLVHVRPGVYRETLTVDVSGAAGNAIEYRGDYAGLIWPSSAGQVVRITGSDNDQTATRANCISGASRNYRTFTGFQLDTVTGNLINLSGWISGIIDKCLLYPPSAAAASILIQAGAQLSCTVKNSFFVGHGNQSGIIISHSSAINNSGHVIQNCIFTGGLQGVRIDRVGGATVKNCLFVSRPNTGIHIVTALTVGQTTTVDNCVFQGCATALSATATGEITEDYNTFFACTTNRTNTNTGANSVTYPTLFDARWFFQLVNAGAGPNHATQLISPFDLSQWSQLINLAGTSPTTTDMRGTAVQGAQREWGALEYDPTLSIKARQASSIDGGGMVV